MNSCSFLLVCHAVGPGQLPFMAKKAQAAPSVEPAEVKFRVAGEIGGVAVQGYIDIIDVHGDVIDVKTAAKKPSGVRADYGVQVATCAMLAPKASGRTRLQTLTKTKTVQFHTQTINVTEADRQHTTKVYQIAAGRDAVWTVRPESQLVPVLAQVLLVLRAVCGGVRVELE